MCSLRLGDTDRYQHNVGIQWHMHNTKCRISQLHWAVLQAQELGLWYYLYGLQERGKVMNVFFLLAGVGGSWYLDSTVRLARRPGLPAGVRHGY